VFLTRKVIGFGWWIVVVGGGGGVVVSV